ncbi:MAG TPA: LacI family DNA-binding transcriptional regulator [Verrucomicrobiae bacterium]|jgi:DNA-binding LacI/PurR family transcriptional regulator|nr:LacI family DNA-binding transcriptional regulator [Verrucomicrobiae bacterium]
MRKTNETSQLPRLSAPAQSAAMVTIRDVAKESGFSSTTVSIVLNNAPLSRYIPAATKKKIERAAQRLGYRPNQFARSLRSKRSHTVGVMVFDMTDPYCTLVLRGIENTLYQASYLPILTDVHNERSRFERYLEMLLDRRMEGLIVLANWLFLDINLLGDLEKSSSIPTAMIGCELKTESISSVIVDNELGGYLALEHLLSLGHRKIAFIRGPRALTDSSPRWRGIRQCARSCELEIDTRLIAELPESRDPMSSFEAGQKLTEDLIRQKRAFTAVLAFDDMSAFGAIRALTKAGIRVPEQCSVIGFDDVAPSVLYSPPLTTVRQPMEDMGASAVEIVLEGINAKLEQRESSALHRKVAPELVVRESTRNLG